MYKGQFTVRQNQNGKSPEKIDFRLSRLLV